MPWAKRATKNPPGMHSQKVTYEFNDYSQGYNSFIANDKMPLVNGASNMLRLAQDARIVTLGDYETRKGFDFHSDAAGVTLDQSNVVVTGAADQSFNTTRQLADKFTAGTTGQLTKLEVNLKNDASATGTILVCLYTDAAGSPGVLLATSSIASASPVGTYAYYPARFALAPTVTAGTTYWVVCYVQAVGSGSYKWSSTTSGTTAKVSTDTGLTWTAISYSLNFKQYYATAGATKGLFRATKSDGTKVTLFAQGTTLYSVNNVTGALTAIKTGLSANATLYRFAMANDIVYYVNGYDGYRKWDFTTESQINTTNYVDLIVHKGLMFLVRADDPTRFDFSNFALYETFTSTDFANVPAPRTGDPIKSMTSINGYLLIRTYNQCYIYSGENNATFRLDDAPDQKGTFSPDTNCADKSHVYFLSDDGVYRSNGTQPELISQGIQEELRTLQNKATACMAISKGRLYLWFASAGSSYNDSCYVWNLNSSGGLNTVESRDTGAYVSHAVSSFRDNDELLVASSIVGQVYWQELASNDYNNLGAPINFLLQTHYMTFGIRLHYVYVGGPSVLKAIRYWEPRFAAKTGSYTIDCEYASDQRDNWQTYSSPNVQGAGPIWGSSSMVWGAFTWGTSAEVQSSFYVPGEYRRIALRYKHFAARQPHAFLGHTLVVESRKTR